MMDALVSSPVIPRGPLSSGPSGHADSKCSRQQLKRACSEFESMFVYYLLKEMRATIPKSGFMGKGYSEEVYTSMFDLQLSKEIASKRGIGLASTLFDQLGRAHIQHTEGKTSKR